MKQILITLILAFVASAGFAQTPKQHVFLDTIKTVKERIDYSPDTIPVFFKEIIVDKDMSSSSEGVDFYGPAYEHLTPGFIIWQTYQKTGLWISSGTLLTSGSSITMQEYYTTYYHDSASDGKYLYLNKKPVTNKIIYAVKR